MKKLFYIFLCILFIPVLAYAGWRTLSDGTLKPTGTDTNVEVDGSVSVGGAITSDSTIGPTSTAHLRPTLGLYVGAIRTLYPVSSAPFLSGSSTALRLGYNGIFTMYLDSSDKNVGFNTDTFGADMTKGIAIAIGTAPTAGVADAIQLWVADSGGDGTAELYGRDESGNVAAITANVENFPDEISPSKTYPYVKYTKQDYLGVERFIAESRMAELVQAMARTAGLLAADEYIIAYKNVDKRDWDADQQAEVDRRAAGIAEKQAEIAALNSKLEGMSLTTQEAAELIAERDVIKVPEPYTKAPRPKSIDDVLKAAAEKEATK